MVYLLSSTHENGTVSEASGKPDIVEFYNSTKGTLDSFDKMSSIYSIATKHKDDHFVFFMGLKPKNHFAKENLQKIYVMN